MVIFIIYLARRICVHALHFKTKIEIGDGLHQSWEIASDIPNDLTNRNDLITQHVSNPLLITQSKIILEFEIIE